VSEPFSPEVYICDFVFGSTPGDRSVIILHETAHQVGFFSELEATFVSNLIYILSEGVRSKFHGYESRFNFDAMYTAAENAVKPSMNP
jgi:hypothetical protein